MWLYYESLDIAYMVRWTDVEDISQIQVCNSSSTVGDQYGNYETKDKMHISWRNKFYVQHHVERIWLSLFNIKNFLSIAMHIKYHYSCVIMSAMASQITSVSSVCSTVCSDADQRKYHRTGSLAFVRGIHRWPLNYAHKGRVTRIYSIWWRRHS